RELLRVPVAGGSECVDLAPFGSRTLRDEMRGRSEPVESQPPRIARHAQRPVADQAGAEQRRRLRIRIARWKGEAVPLVCERELRVAAVDLVAGEPRPVAEVLPARAAPGAFSASPSQPGD